MALSAADIGPKNLPDMANKPAFFREKPPSLWCFRAARPTGRRFFGLSLPSGITFALNKAARLIAST
jgi:hypothetical protein